MLNEVTELAYMWLNSWEVVPLVQKRPEKITRIGILNEGYTQKYVDRLFSMMLEKLLPKLRRAISRNLDSFYTMNEALQDCRERIYYYILATWKPEIQPNFERQACLACDTWTRTVIRNIRNRNSKETPIEVTESTGSNSNVIIAVKTDMLQTTPDLYIAELPIEIQEIAAFLIDNYNLSKVELRKSAMQKFGFKSRDYDRAILNIKTFMIEGEFAL